jgi:hypothetical protein
MNLQLHDRADTNKIKKGLKILQEIKEAGIRPSHFLLEGIINLLQNKMPDSFKSIENAIKSAPPDDSAPHFSMAFLKFYNGNIEEGVKELHIATRRGMKKGLDGMASIIGWYEEALVENKNKKYLNYPLGILYNEVNQKILEKECLSLFLNDFRENQTVIIKQMKYEAEKRLRRL